MTEIRITFQEHSPEVCKLFFDAGYEEKELPVSLFQAIELRNKLTEAITEHQKPLLKTHISNVGQQAEKL